MSFQAVTWAIEQRAGNPSAKAVLWSIANYANEHGVAWPSQARIAADSEQSPDTVQRRLTALAERGLLRRIPLRFSGRKTIDFFVLPISPYFDAPLDAIEELLPRGCTVDPAAHAETGDERSSETDSDVAADCGSAQPQTLPQSAAHATALLRQQEPVMEPKEPVERECAREGLSEEAKRRLALFRRRWPTSAFDDRAEIDREWSKLSDVDQQAALDAIEPFLTDQKASGRTKLVGGVKYLHERRFEFVAIPQEPTGSAPLVIKAWSQEWWAVLLSRLDRAQPVWMLRDAAMGTAGSRETTVRASELPSLEGFRGYPSDGEAWAAWRPWLAARGIDLPNWRERMWVHLPHPRPPPDGQRIFDAVSSSERV